MKAPDDVREVVDELANSLQTAVLTATALEDHLRESEWTEEAQRMGRAVRRAARAAFRLRRWAHSER